ncbi:MAG: DUF5678 domain-containing protein [Thermoplasmata archaeon]
MAHRVGKAAANMRWLSDNMPDLRGRYLHKFVAVHEGRILAVADDQESVFRQLKRMKGLDIGVVAIEFITEEGTTWILW